MITSREDFLMQILHCGVLDLKLIDDVGYDWCDIIKADSTFPFNINGVMRQVFDYGFGQIENAVESRLEYLRDTQSIYGISDEQREELKALEWLNVWKDFGSYHNWIDTHVWCEKHGSIYQKYLGEALDDFAEGTGFEIDFSGT